jgi:cyclophilin family peptidyl-prolyl cis-trans isomerase
VTHTVAAAALACPSVPSAKRERQRAARDEKLAEMEKAKKRSRALRRVIIAIVIAGAITGIVYLITEPGSKPAATTTTSSSTTSTTASTTTTTQPTVTTATAPTCPTGTVERHIKFTHAPPTCIDVHATYLATVKTDVGTFVIRLPAAQNPVAVNNFVFLSRWHFYNGIIFQRVIPGFMNQGGDPTGTGAGGPGYQWTGNTPKGCTTTRTRGTCYPLGAVAMANSGTPSTNGSQFFIMNTNGYPLPALYTRFGQVTSGISVVKAIAASGSQSGTPTVVHHMISVTITTAPSS